MTIWITLRWPLLGWHDYLAEDDFGFGEPQTVYDAIFEDEE